MESINLEIAVWGAITGTAALLWNIGRDLLGWHKSKPQLLIKAFFGNSKNKENVSTKCVFIQIESAGGRTTSVYSFTMKTWPTRWHYWFNLCKPTAQALKIIDVSLDGTNAWPSSSVFMKEGTLLVSGSYRLFIAEIPTMTPYKNYSRVNILHTSKKKGISASIYDGFSALE